MTYNINYDVSRFLDASIHEVLRTLVEAFVLVFIVVFIFLQDLRSTLIPALAVPVAIVGTFFFMQLLGFSINLLTLFALVLSIGIVVDNAIVVVEAVHYKMMTEHLGPMEATIGAMKNITGALVAITLVMSAVFLPVAFMTGPVGVFYRQFSLTLAISIVISGINALTLTPALCAILLRHTPPNKWFKGFNKGYEKISTSYGRLLFRIAERKWVTLAMLGFFVIATWGFASWLPGGFIPTEDQGMIYVNVTTPPGATVERTERVLSEMQKVAASLPDVESVSTLAGYSLVNEVAGASYGMGMVNLKPWGERKTSMEEMIRQLEKKTKDIGDALIQYFPPPTIPGFGNASGFEIRVLDRTGSDDLTKTATVTSEFIEALNRTPEIAGAFSTFDASFPQYLISVDQSVAAQKGVTIDKAMSTLQTLMGSYYASNFIRFGQMYKVMVQASPEYRTKPEDILKVHVKNEKGEMVPLSTFVRLQPIHGPEQLTRYNMYTSAMVTGDAAPGFSSGQAIDAIARTGKDKLPRGYTFDWSGMTREQILSGNQAAFIFLICLVFVYLLLAAQYESFLLPLAVILSLPAGILGSFFFLKIAGLENNIYAQVALVMLIGLLGKNAILIVEFAVQRQREGARILAAAVEGAKERLRPILMTSFAFVAGLLPLCFADGAGALGNRSIGTAAAGGMLFGTVFGVVVVPGLYVLFASIKHRRQQRQRRRNRPAMAVALLFLFIVAGVGCNTPARVTAPKAPSLPANFAGSTDTNSIANIPIRQFFPDLHLQQLIDTAVRNNPDMQMALSRIEITASNIRVSKSALYPQVDAVVALSKYRNGDNTLNGAATDHFVGLRSNWEVDLWGKLKGRKKAAVARWLASREGSRMVVTSLVAQVAVLYYDLLALDNEQRVLDRNIQLQENALEVVKVQKEAGRATELAVQQFQAQLFHTQGLRYTTAQQIVETENQMNFLTGRIGGVVARDSSLLAVPVPERVSAGLPAQLLLNRPDIRAAELELQAAHADISAARAAFFPSLVLSPYAGFNAFHLEHLFDAGSLVWGLTGAALSPLLNRAPIRADYARATAEAQVAYWDYRRVVLGSYKEVENSLQGIRNYSGYLRLKQREAASLNHAVAVANDLYLLGKASYLEVITAQRSVLDAELEVTGARKEVLMQVVSLYRGVGGGWR